MFCLNRVKSDTSVNTVSDLMKSRGISVFSCYVVSKKSITQNDSSDEQSTPRFISMRVCISVYHSWILKRSMILTCGQSV